MIGKNLRPLAAVWMFVAIITGGWLTAQNTSSTALQGSWTVVGAEHEGKPMEGLNGGIMTVTGDQFEIQTASGSLLKGKLKLDAAKSPAEMDMIHDSGMLWEAVYEIDGDTFRLNYVPAGAKDKRPTNFRTSKETEASLVILKRTKQ